MRSAPRKLSTEDALYAAALRALTRRAHSVFQMRTYLERRSEDASLARRVLDRLKQHNYINDERYAVEFARTRVSLRRQGRFRIAQELRQRGVPDRHIEPALDQIFAETDETALVRKVIERRLRALRGPLDTKKLASLHRMLLRSGFDGQLIHRELQRTRQEVAAAEPPDAYSDQDEA